MKGSNLSPGISSFSGLLLMYKLELVPMSDRLLIPVVGAMHDRANLAKNTTKKKKKKPGGVLAGSETALVCNSTLDFVLLCR